ncbi:MAG: hypothetical protein D3920_00885 [Candidatus Electrothrix sp. AW2]|nr:hypothetical protein [Candidatus Electrothrix gigas]
MSHSFKGTRSIVHSSITNSSGISGSLGFSGSSPPGSSGSSGSSPPGSSGSSPGRSRHSEQSCLPSGQTQSSS